MNWVGGARQRIKMKQERRIQKEFFERKRKEKKFSSMKAQSQEQEKRDFIMSQDLMFLYPVQSKVLSGACSVAKRPVNFVDMSKPKQSRIQHNVKLEEDSSVYCPISVLEFDRAGDNDMENHTGIGLMESKIGMGKRIFEKGETPLPKNILEKHIDLAESKFRTKLDFRHSDNGIDVRAKNQLTGRDVRQDASISNLVQSSYDNTRKYTTECRMDGFAVPRINTASIFGNTRRFFPKNVPEETENMEMNKKSAGNGKEGATIFHSTPVGTTAKFQTRFDFEKESYEHKESNCFEVGSSGGDVEDLWPRDNTLLTKAKFHSTEDEDLGLMKVKNIPSIFGDFDCNSFLPSRQPISETDFRNSDVSFRNLAGLRQIDEEDLAFASEKSLTSTSNESKSWAARESFFIPIGLDRQTIDSPVIEHSQLNRQNSDKGANDNMSKTPYLSSNKPYARSNFLDKYWEDVKQQQQAVSSDLWNEFKLGNVLSQTDRRHNSITSLHRQELLRNEPENEVDDDKRTNETFTGENILDSSRNEPIDETCFYQPRASMERPTSSQEDSEEDRFCQQMFKKPPNLSVSGIHFSKNTMDQAELETSRCLKTDDSQSSEEQCKEELDIQKGKELSMTAVSRTEMSNSVNETLAEVMNMENESEDSTLSSDEAKLATEEQLTHKDADEGNVTELEVTSEVTLNTRRITTESGHKDYGTKREEEAQLDLKTQPTFGTPQHEHDLVMKRQIFSTPRIRTKNILTSNFTQGADRKSEFSWIEKGAKDQDENLTENMPKQPKTRSTETQTESLHCKACGYDVYNNCLSSGDFDIKTDPRSTDELMPREKQSPKSGPMPGYTVLEQTAGEVIYETETNIQERGIIGEEGLNYDEDECKKLQNIVFKEDKIQTQFNGETLSVEDKMHAFKVMMHVEMDRLPLSPCVIQTRSRTAKKN